MGSSKKSFKTLKAQGLAQADLSSKAGMRGRSGEEADGYDRRDASRIALVILTPSGENKESDFLVSIRLM
jgi:hypothetical protein